MPWQTWEQQLKVMQRKEDDASASYQNGVLKQEEERVEAEREEIRQKHKMDCIYLRKYGMKMNECREHYKEDGDHDCHKTNDYDIWLREKENPSGIPDWDEIENIHYVG